ncbi:MAG: hypothetical protein RL375_3012 [Pseudomonadota bacterium]|jgi:hypothetical protein
MAEPTTPGSTPRRLLWAAWLTAVVLTSLGHSGSINPLDYGPKEPEACVPGSEQIVASGVDQSGRAGAPLGRSLALRFVCTSTLGGPLSGPPPRDLVWQVTSGGGTIDGVLDVRNRIGGFDGSAQVGLVAQVNWSLGPDVIGTQVVTATVDGRVFTFQATALPAGDGSGRCSDDPALGGTQFGAGRAILGTETWTLAGSPYRGEAVAVYPGGKLQIDPGVQVCLSGGLDIGGQLLAVGTAAQPVRFIGAAPRGLSLGFGGHDARSELRFVTGTGISRLNSIAHPLLIEDTQWQALPSTPAGSACLSNVFVAHATTPVLLRRTVFDGFGGPSGPLTDCPAVQLRATPDLAGAVSSFEATVHNAVRMGVMVFGGGPGGWQLQGCEVSGSGADGIVVHRSPDLHNALEPGVEAIHGCALFGNVGKGVNNLLFGAFTVDARSNWWGDPAGASGPAGDGVSAGVDASAPLGAAPAPN